MTKRQSLNKYSMIIVTIIIAFFTIINTQKIYPSFNNQSNLQQRLKSQSQSPFQIKIPQSVSIFQPITNPPAIYLLNITTPLQTIMQNSTINPNFTGNEKMDCSMPNLYIYQDYTHLSYYILFQNVTLINITSWYSPIQYVQNCTSGNNCLIIINNKCEGNGKNQINVIQIQIQSLSQSTQSQYLQYKVNCAPQLFYKPFQWGLFILIFFSTITIILSSLYSKAWSYGCFSITINIWIIIALNIIIIIGTILAYFIPNVVSIGLKVIGSGVGTIGVMICFSQTVYLFKCPILIKQLFWKIRIIDIISLLFGIIITIVYWVTNGFWFVNDIEAVCSIIALIKIFKVRSLKIAILLVFPLLIIEIIVGLIVHYFLQISYNNYVINLFQSPIIIVFPSITPQLFRKCAWLPLTSIIMPGLVTSYFRRFDLSRSTHIYLLIGWISFLFGSIAWIFIDMSTIHSLPFAIISQPVMFLFVFLISWRRNQLKTLWNGMFYDPQIKDMTQNLLKESQSDINGNISQNDIRHKASIQISKLVDQAGNINYMKNTQSQSNNQQI